MSPMTTTSRPPFDPELEAALRARQQDVVVSMTADEIPAVRATSVPLDPATLTASGELELTDLVVPAPQGDVTVVLLRPRNASGPLPVLFFLHGGGLVTGDAYSDLPAIAELALATGSAVASTAYRLAPEHPFPAAIDDAFAALTWVRDAAPGLGLDADRFVATGVSAGGGLAAALVHHSWARGGPSFAGQLLVCPMLDDRNETTSAHQMAGAGSWDRTANLTAWTAYLGDAVGAPDVPASASASRATDLSWLPPTFVDVGSAETFRDECVEYASRIWAAGGDAELHVWPGGIHAFDFFEPGATMSKDARAARVRWLTRLLDRPGR